MFFGSLHQKHKLEFNSQIFRVVKLIKSVKCCMQVDLNLMVTHWLKSSQKRLNMVASGQVAGTHYGKK